MKRKVLVGMSGGVDSSVAAALLKEDGYSVSGLFMKVWDERYDREDIAISACYGPEGKDIEDAKKVAQILGIELYIVDLVKEYRDIVLSYFKKEYLSGRTPNPCVVCNRFLKFGLLLDRFIETEKKRFDLFATGHYAIVEYERKKGRYILKKGRDKAKEQSYFLFLLTQQQLSRAAFPLGSLTKKEVRSIARRLKLPVSGKEESQDFIAGGKGCILGDNTGDIVDKEGNILGRYSGFFTIGQRKGLGIARGKPLYVMEIDRKTKRMVVGEKKDVYKKEFIVEGLNWVSVEGIDGQVRADVRVRYKHSGAKATIYPVDKKDEARVVFDQPQWAITPGQAAVFYDGEVLLGGGFIKNVYG